MKLLLTLAGIALVAFATIYYIGGVNDLPLKKGGLRFPASPR